MKKKPLLITTALVGALALTGAYGVSVANAETGDYNFPPIVQRMVEKFNLNSEEVEQLVEEDRAEHQADMQQNLTDRLDELVSSGDITEDQVDQILAKEEELRAVREDLRDQDLSWDERHDQMDELRTQMQDYLVSIGVEESVFPLNGPRAGLGGGEGLSGMHQGQMARQGRN